MPRYIVERTFVDGRRVPDEVERNAEEGVTWLHSYVSEERQKTFCLYDAPSPEAIRRTSARNALPVDQITQVRVLDPYVYVQEEPWFDV
jgi:Protein of unknown function (DUF4242)